MTLFLIIVLLIVVCLMTTIIIALMNGQDLKSFEFIVPKLIMIRAVLGGNKADEARNNTGLKQKKCKKQK